MKVCKHCNVELIPGENIYPSLYKNYDYRCKECNKKKTSKYYKTDKGKELLKRYTKTDVVKKVNNRWKYKYKGVYGLFENGVCLYIGESKRINKRLVEHRDNTKSQRDNPQKHLYQQLKKHNFISGIVEICDNHKEREQYYIDIYKPLYNK